MRCPIEPLAEALAYAPRPWFSSTLVPIFSAFMTHLAIMAGFSWTPGPDTVFHLMVPHDWLPWLLDLPMSAHMEMASHFAHAVNGARPPLSTSGASLGQALWAQPEATARELWRWSHGGAQPLTGPDSEDSFVHMLKLALLKKGLATKTAPLSVGHLQQPQLA
jgi:hypothetical protein